MTHPDTKSLAAALALLEVTGIIDHVETCEHIANGTLYNYLEELGELACLKPNGTN